MGVVQAAANFSIRSVRGAQDDTDVHEHLILPASNQMDDTELGSRDAESPIEGLSSSHDKGQEAKSVTLI